MIRDDLEAHRIISAWPSVPRAEDGSKLRKETLIRVWAETANVRTMAVAERYEMLFRCGFCVEDGTVPDVVLGYLANVALSGIKRPGGAPQRRQT